MTTASTAVSHLLKQIAAGMSIVVHPFLFALFPVLAVYAYNMQEISLSELAFPVVVALGSALALFFLSILVLRDGNKAGIVVSVVVVLFYSYGLASFVLAPHLPWNPETLLLPLWALLLALGVGLIGKIRWNMRKLTVILNVAAVVMIVVPVVRIGVGEIRRLALGSEHEAAPMGIQLREPDQPLDIYYIILDSYAGSNHLMAAYDYDNEAFIDYLSDKGFYIASADVPPVN